MVCFLFSDFWSPFTRVENTVEPLCLKHTGLKIQSQSSLGALFLQHIVFFFQYYDKSLNCSHENLFASLERCRFEDRFSHMTPMR